MYHKQCTKSLPPLYIQSHMISDMTYQTLFVILLHLISIQTIIYDSRSVDLRYLRRTLPIGCTNKTTKCSICHFTCSTNKGAWLHLWLEGQRAEQDGDSGKMAGWPVVNHFMIPVDLISNRKWSCPCVLPWLWRPWEDYERNGLIWPKFHVSFKWTSPELVMCVCVHIDHVRMDSLMRNQFSGSQENDCFLFAVHDLCWKLMSFVE